MPNFDHPVGISQKGAESAPWGFEALKSLGFLNPRIIINSSCVVLNVDLFGFDMLM